MYIKPVAENVLLATYFVCSEKYNLSLMIIPRNLVEVTLSMEISLTLRSTGGDETDVNNK